MERSASVIKEGVVYVNVCVSRRLKEQLAWVIDNCINGYGLLVIKCYFKTVVPLRN